MESAMAEYTLSEIAEKARKHVVTPEERRAQRVSMIMGVRSKKSTFSREKVEHMLDEFEGQQPKAVASR